MKYYAIFQGLSSMAIMRGQPFPWHTRAEAQRALDRIRQEYPDYEDEEGLYVACEEDVPSSRYVTNAPPDYDGFDTHTIAVFQMQRVGMRSVWRIVDVHDRHAEWQTMRYHSRMYTAMPIREWTDDASLYGTLVGGTLLRAAHAVLREDM